MGIVFDANQVIKLNDESVLFSQISRYMLILGSTIFLGDFGMHFLIV